MRNKGCVVPNQWRGSTTLNPSITSYDRLAERILRSLGSPNIVVEAECGQLYDFIDQAIEWYSKYAGYTEEYLLFDSRIYVQGLGVKLDELFNITPEFKNQRYRDVCLKENKEFDSINYVTYNTLTSLSTISDSILSAGNSTTFYDVTSLTANNYNNFNIITSVSGLETIWTEITAITANINSITRTFSCATFSQLQSISSTQLSES